MCLNRATGYVYMSSSPRKVLLQAPVNRLACVVVASCHAAHMHLQVAACGARKPCCRSSPGLVTRVNHEVCWPGCDTVFAAMSCCCVCCLPDFRESDDEESEKCHLGAIIVRDLSIVVSNYRSTMSVDEYCKKHNVLGIANLDTRSLTKVLRETGCLNGVITTGEAQAQGYTTMYGL